MEAQSLKIGQRFDVWEVLPENVFFKIEKDDMLPGSQKVELENYLGSGVYIDSKYGKCYHSTVGLESNLKKIGTLIITKLK